MRILLDKRAMFGKYRYSVIFATALKVAASTEWDSASGFPTKREQCEGGAGVLYQGSWIVSAVAITDREKLLLALPVLATITIYRANPFHQVIR